jgi:DNA-binding PadR family transcriptional regulator
MPTVAGRTRDGLSAHLTRLRTAGYVAIEKSFAGKMPRTLGRLTNEGRDALATYRQQIGAVIGTD